MTRAKITVGPVAGLTALVAAVGVFVVKPDHDACKEAVRQEAVKAAYAAAGSNEVGEI